MKLIGYVLSIIAIILGALIIYKVAVNGMNNMVENLATGCIKTNIEKIKDMPMCEQYKNHIQNLPSPNCGNGKTITAITAIRQEARKNSCLIN
jgi:hypothetical protein